MNVLGKCLLNKRQKLWICSGKCCKFIFVERSFRFLFGVWRYTKRLS